MIKNLLKIVAIITIPLTVALIPEAVMFMIYNSTNPADFWQSAALLTLFFIGGGSFCVLFAMFGLALFVTLTETLL